MKHTVKIRELEIGEGIPKICVPVMGRTGEEVLEAAGTAAGYRPDLIEWRADHLDGAADTEKTLEILKSLRADLGGLPLLFTFRTKREGGAQELSGDDYLALCALAARSGFVDLLDVELFLGEELVAQAVRTARENGVKVILSNHDFAATPAKEELVRRLTRMQELGADIAKIAVTPVCRADVLTLLAATEECSRLLAVPVVTMSMGALGAVSRVLGETFGSALTFGMAGTASAPGQIPVEALRELLYALHACL